MPASRALAGALKQPFAEQVAFFRAKLGTLVPTQTWRDVQKAEHDRAFMVAGAAKADLLADLAAAVDRAVTEGGSLEAFRRDFGAIVGRHGWDYRGDFGWRTRVIYRTNAATSYAAGRLAQLRAGGFGWWMYKHGGSRDPRPQHLAWDGLVLPADHPFWSSHFPPNGWGCSCRAVGLRRPEAARRLGGDPDKVLPGGWDTTDPRTGEPPGIDPGWGYQPGNTVSETVRAMASKTVQWPYELAKAFMAGVPEVVRDELATSLRALPSLADDVRRYAQRALGDTGAEVQPYRTLGLLTGGQSARVAALTGVEAVELQRYDWAVDRNAVGHIARKHGDEAAEAARGQIAVTPADYAMLPLIVARPDEIVYGGVSDAGHPVVTLRRTLRGVRYEAVFEVRTGRRMLALQTMWKRSAPAAQRP